MVSPDADLRRLERALRSAPSDAALRDRYLRLLARAGRTVEAAFAYRDADRLEEAPPEVLADASRQLMTSGRQVEACGLFGIRWAVDLRTLVAPGGDALHWRKGPIDAAGLARMVGADLARFAPQRLAEHFPRRQDGRYRLNTTRWLARYKAHERRAPHRRLIFIAWTPGTANVHARPEDQGKHIVTVALETRSFRGTVLEPDQWGRD